MSAAITTLGVAFVMTTLVSSTMAFAQVPLSPSQPPEEALPAAELSPASEEASKRSIAQSEVNSAVEAFQGQNFAKALTHFERAIANTEEPQSLSLLLYNAGICLFELKRYSAAEPRFVKAAALSKKTAGAAHAYAGLAALRAGMSDRAQRHLAASEGNDAEARALRAQLSSELKDVRLYQSEGLRRQHIAAGYAALAASRVPAAEQAFNAARAVPGAMPPGTRADLFYGLARVAQAKHESALAVRLLDEAISARATDYEVHWLRGLVHTELGDKSGARADYTRAAKLPMSNADKRALKAAIEALDLLDSSGFGGQVSLGVGFDNNAAQSGLVQSRGFAGAQRQITVDSAAQSAPTSAFWSYYHRLVYNQRLAQRWQVTPAFQMGALALTDDEVRGLSLTTAGLSFALSYAPTLTSRFALSVGTVHSYGSWLPDERFTTERFVGGDMLLQHSTHWFTQANWRMARVIGHGDNEALSGGRAGVGGGVAYRSSKGAASAQVGAQVYRAGKETIPADLDTFPRCQRADCDFSVPLGYFGPHLDLGASYLVLGQLRLDAAVGLQRRFYESDGVLRVTTDRLAREVSLKTRLDWALDLSAGMTHPLYPWVKTGESRAPFHLDGWVRYWRRANHSNLSPDANDPAHQLDYEERNYVQGVSQVGFSVGW